MSEAAISPVFAVVPPLRAKMITEMRVRHFSARTEEAYLHVIGQLY